MPQDPEATPGPVEGESFTVADNLSLGDLAYFSKDWNGEWLLRRLDDPRLARTHAPIFELVLGDKPSEGSLRVLGEAELDGLDREDRET